MILDGSGIDSKYTRKPKQQELEHALAFFSAQNKDSEEDKDISTWLWEVIQGDFYQDPSLGQIALGMVVSMIPIVDQICDIRDFIACSKEIEEKPNDVMPKVMMVIMLIGLVPTLGSFVKGILKIIIRSIRSKFKHIPSNFHRLPIFEKKIDEAIEYGLQQVRLFISREEVKRYIQLKRIGDPYKFVANKLNERIDELRKSTAILLKTANYLLKQVDQVVGYIQRFTKNQKIVKEALEVQKKLHLLIERRLPQILADHEILALAVKITRKIKRRLEIESDMHFRASVNKTNLDKVWYPYLDELEKMKNKTPSWADKNVDRLMYKGHPKPEPPIHQSHFLSEGYPNLGNDFMSFAKNSARAVELKADEVLYRVVSPASLDNSICWMREKEFKKLHNKDEWRRRFAVWGSWNSNGEYLTYKVPSGGLKVWEGTVASQTLDKASRKPAHMPDLEWDKKMQDAKNYSLEGGAIQIALDPTMLQKSNLGQRQTTGWGYGDAQLAPIDLVGVPVLKNNVKMN